MPQRRHRVFAACLCLLAVALVYAPLAGAVWAGHALACCTGDHCNIPEHHHRKAALADTGSRADCDHEGSGMSACSMSCCQDPDKPMVSAFAFVLPSLTLAGAPVLVAGTAKAASSIEIPRTFQPPAPPPRLAAAL
jgi:hypothetical protein